MRAPSFAGAALVLAGCATRTITLHEVSTPLPPAASRPEASVEVHRNGPPGRRFVTRYVIDLASLVPPSEALAKHLESAARVGCDAILVYTAEHPVIKAGPRSEDEVLALGLDGVVASRAIGVTVPNRRAVFVETAKGHVIVVDGPAPAESVALCVAYEAPRSPP